MTLAILLRKQGSIRVGCILPAWSSYGGERGGVCLEGVWLKEGLPAHGIVGRQMTMWTEWQISTKSYFPAISSAGSNDGVARKWVTATMWNNSVVFNKRNITRVIAELCKLSLMKRTLKWIPLGPQQRESFFILLLHFHPSSLVHLIKTPWDTYQRKIKSRNEEESLNNLFIVFPQ